MFDNEAALYACGFIELLKHTDGEFYGQPFDLLPWQHAAVSQFYGELKDSGYRQYQYLYLEIPKKNGKSELAAALGLYHTFADGEMRGEVYVCAADRQNAGIVFDVAVAMIEQNPALKKRCRITESRKEILDKVTKTRMKVMSSEAFSKHGYKPSCVIFDELHAQPKRDLWDVMTFGAGSARSQPVWIVLTTAGDDPDRVSIGWEQHEYARKVLEFRDGNIEEGIDDPTWLPFIYGAPEDADIFDEGTWYQANPSLGYTIPIETVRQEALTARNSEAKERLFRWLRLNQWIALKTIGWLPLTLFDQTVGNWSPADLLGKKCYPGLDLGSTVSLAAAVLVFPPQEGIEDWRVLYEAWIPEDDMKEREERDHVPFSSWVKNKYLHATPGNVVDYDFIESRLVALSKQYRFEMLGTDPWNSRMLTQRLTKISDTECIEIPQTITGMSPPMKEMERLLRSGQMTHEKNPCARWCFGNVKVAVDGNENYKPMKNKSVGRIDITVAWINAMATAMLNEGKKPVYEQRGMRSLM
jgi:phage terminase large subunit-like protein